MGKCEEITPRRTPVTLHLKHKIQTVLRVWIASRSTWQGWQVGNKTFEEDNWNFDIEELREVLGRQEKG